MLRYAIGMVYAQFGKRDEAIPPLTEALELREQLVKADPENPRYRTDLASSLIGLGDLERQDRPARCRRALVGQGRADPEPGGEGSARRHRASGKTSAGFTSTWDATTRPPPTSRRSWPSHPTRRTIGFITPRGVSQIRALAASEGAFAKLLERNPGDGSLWSGRGRYYLLRDRWDRAAADFARAVETSPPESEEWIEHAALRLLVGDAAGYREFLREILRKAGGTRDPFVGYVLARACNLSAEPVVDPAELVRLAELGARGGNYPWFLQPVGIALYRAGRYREAIRSLERTPEDRDTVGEKKLVLGMAYQRLGETKKARVLLDEGRTWVKEARGSGVSGAADQAPTDWVTTQVYLREAEALILYDPIFPADPFAR